MTPDQSSMHWGVECDPGWYSILDTLCRQIQRHIDNPPFVKKTGWEGFKCDAKLLWNLTVWNKVVYPFISKRFSYETYQKLANRFQFRYIPYSRPEKPIPQVVFTQVKEKFGGLRIYYRGGDDYVQALVSFAESISYRTCEVCGRMDDTVGRNRNGWIRTTCIEHAKSITDFFIDDQQFVED